jgi:general secretion pathway protein L
MFDPIILFVTDLTATELMWCAPAAAAAEPQRGSWAAFGDWLAERSERRVLPVCVLLPDAGCSRMQVAIPGTSREKALQALPFALEDLALDEPNQLVSVLGLRPQAPGLWPVLLVNASLRTQVLAALGQLGLAPSQMLSAADVLPLPEPGDFTVWAEPASGSLSVLTGAHEGMAFPARAGMDPAEQLAHMLTRLEHPPARVTLHMVAAQPPNWPAAIQFNTQPEPALAQWCGIWRTGLSANQPLSAIESPRAANHQKSQRRWRQAAGFLLAVLGLTLVNQSIDTWKKDRLIQQLNQQIERDFHAALPDVTRVVNIQVQLQQALDARNAGAASDGLLPMLAYFGAAYHAAQPEDPKLAIESLQWSEQKLTLSLVAEKYTVLQKLFEQLKTSPTAVNGFAVSQIDAGVDAGVAHMRIGVEQAQ